MGNLVTNGLILTGRDDDLRSALESLCDEPWAGPVMLPEFGNQVDYLFNPQKLLPQPDSITATQDLNSAQVDLGLSVMARNGPDFLKIKQERDPVLREMPARFQQTAQSLLLKSGLLYLSGEDLERAAERVSPGCIAAAAAAIKAYEETESFDWCDWRLKTWGSRSFGEHLYANWREGFSLEIRFDSLNQAPVGLISAFAKAHPDVSINGAGYDEDSDYSVFFVSDPDEASGLAVYESDDPDSVCSARRLIHVSIDEDEGPAL